MRRGKYLHRARTKISVYRFFRTVLEKGRIESFKAGWTST